MSDEIAYMVMLLVTLPIVIGLIAITGKLNRIIDKAQTTNRLLESIDRELEKLNGSRRR